MKLFLLLVLLLTFFSCSKEDPNRSIIKSGNFILKAGSVAGRITDKDGNGLVGVTVITDKPGFSTVSGINGNYILHNIDADVKYQIIYIKNGFVDTYYSDSLFITSGDTTKNIDVKMSSSFCSIKGKVLFDESINDSNISLQGVGISVPQQSKTAISDADGNFTINNLEVSNSNEELIIAAKSGGGWGDNKILLTPGKTTEVELKITKVGGVIKGYLLDANQQPLSGVTITGVGGGVVDTTADDGSYILKNVPSENGINITAKDKNGNIYNGSGLEVNDGCSLEGVKLSRSNESTGDITILDKTYFINNVKTNVILNADIVSGDSLISSFIWDLNNDNKFDKITSKNQVIATLNNKETQIINYAVISINGDTTDVAKITVEKVSSQPTVKLLKSTNTNLKINQQGNLAIDVECLNGGIKSYQWDFNGDGIFDWTNFETGNLYHKYFYAGSFNSKVEVKTLDNLSAKDSIDITVSSEIDNSEGFIYPPKIISPIANSNSSTNLEIKWNKVDKSTGYNIYLSDVYPFKEAYVTNTSGDDTTTFASLKIGTKYYLQVEAISGELSNSSYTIVFTTNSDTPKPTATLISPNSGDTISGDDSVSLNWNVISTSFPNAVYSKLHFGTDNPPNFYKNISTTTYSGNDISIKVMPSGGFIEGWYYWFVDGFDGNDSAKTKVDSIYVTAPREWTEVNHLGTSTADYKGSPAMTSFDNSGEDIPFIGFLNNSNNPVFNIYDKTNDKWNNATPADLIGKAYTGYEQAIFIKKIGNSAIIAFQDDNDFSLLKYDYDGVNGTWSTISTATGFDIFGGTDQYTIRSLGYDGTDIYVVAANTNANDDYYTSYNGSNWSSPTLAKELITRQTDIGKTPSFVYNFNTDISTGEICLSIAEDNYDTLSFVHILHNNGNWVYSAPVYGLDNLEQIRISYVSNNNDIKLTVDGYNYNLSKNQVFPLSSTNGSSFTSMGTLTEGSALTFMKDTKRDVYYTVLTQYTTQDNAMVYMYKNDSWNVIQYNGNDYLQSDISYPIVGSPVVNGGFFVMYGDASGAIYVWKY